MSETSAPPSQTSDLISPSLLTTTGVSGKYRLLRRIGEGGMGTVFEAEQIEPRRRVAIKLLRDRLSMNAEGIALFRREAQALARLRHPAIAMIYESGTSAEGLPFFAMELVRGVSLSEWLVTRPLSPKRTDEIVRRRLDLFRQICAGVSYAHRRGVIHRDLKPSNIMVRTEELEDESSIDVKILDFGIALIQDTDPVTGAVTDPGTIRGTLAYMSPEQTGGNPYEVDSRSDVYALGVILYQLLSGRLPYETLGKSPIELLAAVNTQDPLPLSGIWRELGVRLGSDLEAIVLKALAKDPEERYQSVSALSDDVGRYEAGLPVVARAPTLIYQLRKLIKRYRLPAAVAASVVMVLAAATVVTSLQRTRALRADAESRREAQKSGAVLQFLQRMLASADPFRGARDVTVAEVLDQAAREISGTLVNQPEIEAAVRQALGATYEGLGRFPEAEEQLRLARIVAQKAPETTEAKLLNFDQDLAALRWRQGRYRQADSIASGVLERRRHLFGDDNADVATSLNLLGSIAYSMHDLQRADSLLTRSIEVRRRLLGDDALLVTEARENLASVRYEQGRYAAAESLFAAALGARLRGQGRNHPDYTSTLNSLAMALSAQERFKDAEPYYQEALATNRRIFGDKHPRIAQSINNLGMFYYRQRRYAEAEPLLREGVAMNEALLGRNNPEVATGLNNLALVALNTTRYATAESLFRQTLQIASEVHGDTSPVYAGYLKSLALTQARAGKATESESNYRRALAIQGRNVGLPKWEAATTKNMLGALYVSSKRYPEAEKLFAESFPVIRAQFGDAHDRTRVARDRFIQLYVAWGKQGLADSVRQLDSTARHKP